MHEKEMQGAFQSVVYILWT